MGKRSDPSRSRIGLKEAIQRDYSRKLLRDEALNRLKGACENTQFGRGQVHFFGNLARDSGEAGHDCFRLPADVRKTYLQMGTRIMAVDLVRLVGKSAENWNPGYPEVLAILHRVAGVPHEAIVGHFVDALSLALKEEVKSNRRLDVVRRAIERPSASASFAEHLFAWSEDVVPLNVQTVADLRAGLLHDTTEEAVQALEAGPELLAILNAAQMRAHIRSSPAVAALPCRAPSARRAARAHI